LIDNEWMNMMVAYAKVAKKKQQHYALADNVVGR
jgi:hypothetical protein